MHLLKLFTQLSSVTKSYDYNFRQELYNFGVKVSILEPGIFRTPLLDEQAMLKRVDHVWTQIDDETRTEYGETFKNYCEFWNTHIRLSKLDANILN